MITSQNNLRSNGKSSVFSFSNNDSFIIDTTVEPFTVFHALLLEYLTFQKVKISEILMDVKYRAKKGFVMTHELH